MGTLAKFLGGAVTGMVGLGLAAWLSTKIGNEKEDNDYSDEQEDE